MTLLSLDNVSKTYGSGHTEVKALKNMDFSVEPGEFVAVIGPSGSGKSTFLSIAGGLLTPSTGTVKINNQSFAGLKKKELAKLRFKELGFILQSSNLVPFLTVKDQLILVDKVQKKNLSKKKKEDLLESLDIIKLKDKYPKDLSGGERQRVAIARALYNEPSVILADEPTASLDTNRAYEVVKILAKETKDNQTATIMVTHDTRLLDHCDKVYEMNDGVLKQIR
ncbi:putative ABC transport system ATP-binding protein [Isobaculum melis]|uniref:Putative hemin import ATP-binding protein HrtA n=2 Tax=Isobaculum melis TaxID=142588 RepID=A0A1H9UCW1_9LACT|nr:putative ABC transport system ATP-binding protein [Isobaculum melis]